MITCTRKLLFCAGHRVHGHEGKCRCLHGHNYVLHVTARTVADPNGLDGLGRVVDFSVLKDRLGNWIDRLWDHGFILWDQDHEAIAAVQSMGPHQKLATVPFNPTAENIAAYLLNVVGPQVLMARETGVQLVRVVVWETPNCYAEAILAE